MSENEANTMDVVERAMDTIVNYIAECDFIGAGWGSCIARKANKCMHCNAKEAFDIISDYIKRTTMTVASEYEAVIDDHRRLIRELDIALNGEGAAEQASLCDIVAQVKHEGWKLQKKVKE